MIQVIDNYLSVLQHQKLSEFLLVDGKCEWKYNNRKVRTGNDPYDYQFTHLFHTFHSLHGARHIISPQIDNIKPLIERLQFIALHRIKANLEPVKPKRVYSDFHTDVQIGDRGCPYMTTAIYYVNTNDGYTEFQTGEKIESKANRLVKFPGDLKHRGVSQLDTKVRCVLNLNYFEFPE